MALLPVLGYRDQQLEASASHRITMLGFKLPSRRWLRALGQQCVAWTARKEAPTLAYRSRCFLEPAQPKSDPDILSEQHKLESGLATSTVIAVRHD
eukprot:2601302-Rhodomonas_salina.2